MISWADFSWEAFATLTAGLAAVVGAVIVGFRQVGIQARQTAILEGQARLDMLRYNGELFERRMEVYQATMNYLSSIAQTAKEPEPEIQRAFAHALNSSKFLFAPRVHAELQVIWKEGVTYAMLSRKMERGIDKPEPDWDELVERESAAFAALVDRIGVLADLFGEELKLSHG